MGLGVRSFVTRSEHKLMGGFKERRGPEAPKFSFDRCALGLTPWETPVASPDGIVFDILNIMPYIKVRAARRGRSAGGG
jgi:peptidyl-prolyl cis-trans isomerase-like protein 2